MIQSIKLTIRFFFTLFLFFSYLIAIENCKKRVFGTFEKYRKVENRFKKVDIDSFLTIIYRFNAKAEK